ncbi:MAG: heavy metal translocating P-type ATPase [Rhodospirillaceae bacterium]|nr:heavy metal translocating P-type ATPase [Rhodospirillaceae bacterium]
MSTDTPRLQLNLPLILPNAPDEADACVGRLLNDLNGRPGVDRVHVIAASANEPAKLCVHYDPNKIQLSRLREIVHSTGAQISQRFGHILWHVDGLRHQRRVRTIADSLAGLPGVLQADAALSGVIRIEFDRSQITERAIRDALAKLNVTVSEAETLALEGHTHHPSREKHDHGDSDDHQHSHGENGKDKRGHDHAHGGMLGKNAELYFAILSGVCVALGYVLQQFFAAPAWIPLALYVASYFFGGFYTLREAIENLQRKSLEIDSLMLVAAAGAAVLGEWAEGALLLFLFSIGHSLENFAMGKARKAIEALGQIAPRKAEVIRDGKPIEVSVEELVVGDTVIARPNGRIPADGFVLKGASSVDQAPITGESIPVDKVAVGDAKAAATRPDAVPAESRVYAGTINGAGALEIYVARLASDNTLSRVVKMVSEAEAQKSPTQRFTDKFERIFVPVILAFVGILLFAWTIIDEPFRDSFYRALAVLVAASPCALAIATPSAVLAGVARAARGGVLVKGGGPLENLGSLTAIAFDKTGTLTEGKPRVVDVVPATGVEAQELLAAAISVERLSDHPLAAAVVRDGTEQLDKTVQIPTADNVRAVTGRGVTAMVGSEEVYVGKLALFSENLREAVTSEMKSTANMLELRGRTVMLVTKGKRYLGAIGLMDKPRDAAKSVLATLRKLGVKDIIMLTGDNNLVAEAVGNEVGVGKTYGNLMPEDKVATIQRLMKHGPVAMVGDGVNDAPAMANATVGIAMGAAGSDVALETADVALMADDLRTLPFAVGLSRGTRSIIRQNLWVSLGMVLFLIPATVFGLKIGMAVLLHEGSTILVVVNALRLLAYRDPIQSSA